jgi:hypothetical protein
LALSASRANINFPPELLDMVKSFTKNIPVIKPVVLGSNPGSYPYRIFNITSGKLNNFSEFLPYISFEDFQNFFPQITKTLWAKGKFLTKSYKPKIIVSNNKKEALIFLDFKSLFLPDNLKEYTPKTSFTFISKYIPSTSDMGDYGSQGFYPLDVIADKDISMVKKFIGVK